MSSLPVTPEEPAPAPIPSSTEVNQVAARVAALEQRLSANSWLYGDSLLKRSFAIWGHYFVAQFIISIILFILVFACTALGVFSLSGLINR